MPLKAAERYVRFVRYARNHALQATGSANMREANETSGKRYSSDAWEDFRFCR